MSLSESPFVAADGLAQRLTDSAPGVTELTPALEDELARMSVAAQRETKPARSGRRILPRTAAVVVAGVLAFGGAGAAAAATGGWWTSWWAGDPDYEYYYPLPSGAQCEVLLGNITVTAGPPEVEGAIEEILSADDLVAADEIATEIARMRADKDVWWVGTGGAKEPAWYGTEHYPSPDQEYSNAIGNVITAHVSRELRQHGFDTDQIGYSIEQENNCPGAEW